VPVKILVADDSVTMRRILELTFAGEDAQVTAVDSGDAAIAKASDLRPDVMLVDASMGTDGYKVAAAVRGTPGLERTALIVLASQKNPYDDARGKAAGVDDHLIKPFDTQHVIDKVKKVLGQPRAAAAAGARAPAPQQQAPQQPEVRTSRTGTIAFAQAPAGPGASARNAPPPSPAANKPAAASPVRQAPIAAAATAATAPSGDLARKLDGLGLSADQVAGVLAISKTVIEQVVWEVVPDLAESIIREEIKRLTQ
jgi:CheY-like chemotaxis protein